MFSFRKNSMETSGNPPESDKSMTITSPVITNGIVLHPEGSMTNPPKIDSSLIEKVNYVPLEFAESKFQSLYRERIEMKDLYEKRMNQLTQYHEKNVENIKNHYERFITEIKGKAERHMEIHRILCQNNEDNWKREFKTKDSIIEELRDHAAENTRLNQEEMRKMKQLIKDTEIRCEELMKSLSENQISMECSTVLNRMIGRIEFNECSHHHDISSVMMEKHKLELVDMKIKYQYEISKCDAMIQSLREDLIIYRECTFTLINIANYVERNENIQVNTLSHKMDDVVTIQRLIQEKVNDYEIKDSVASVLSDICMQIEVKYWKLIMDSVRSQQMEWLSWKSNLVVSNQESKNHESKDRNEEMDEIVPLVPLFASSGDLFMSKSSKNIYSTNDSLQFSRTNTLFANLMDTNTKKRSREDYEGLEMKVEEMTVKITEYESKLVEASRTIKSLEMLKRHLSRTKFSNSKLDTSSPKNDSNTSSSLETKDRNVENGQQEQGQDSLHNPDDVIFIEQLEDKLAELKDQVKYLTTTNQQLVDDKVFIRHQLDNMIKEKRTDLVKRLEDEIQEMKNIQSSQSVELVGLRTEKQKAQTLQQELIARVNAAEKEIRDRDAMELAKLSEKEEKYQLKTQIVKQRDEIVMKAKAATAGWDAAANADERLDNEVDKAYQKGIAEGRMQHRDDMGSLNSAIEKKEVRLTELVVQINMLESKVREAELLTIKYQKEMEAAKQETADTVLMFTQFHDSIRSIPPLVSVSTLLQEGSSINVIENREDTNLTISTIGPTATEFESMKEILDQSQEEVLELADKVDQLQEKLNLCEQRANVFEQLLAVERQRFHEIIDKMSTIRMKNNNNNSNSSPNKSNHTTLLNNDLQEAVNIIKASFMRGGALWKSSKKDECYDLYIQMSESVMKKVSNSVEYKKIFIDAMGNAKAQVTSKSNQKSKAAMILKKAAEKFLLIAETKLVDGDETNGDGVGMDNVNKIENEELNMEIRDLQSQLAVLNTLYSSATSANTVINNDTEDELNVREKEGGDFEDNHVDNHVDNHENSEKMNKNINVKNDVDKDMIGSMIPSSTEKTPESGGSSLLRRAKEAEAAVEKLKRQLALMMTVQQSNIHQTSDIDNKGDPFSSSSSLIGIKKNGNDLNSSLDSAEIRRLNRKIKELEAQLQVAKTSHGGSSETSAADKKALALVEKQLQKKIKDLETAFKKERTQLESRAIKAEKSYETTSAMLEPVTKERDLLRAKSKDMISMSEELIRLRKQSEIFTEISAQLEQKTSDYALLSEQFKKEAALRKKYKNDLEDLRGAIRVFARCRPMAQYEKDTNCKQVVQFKDDMSLRLFTSRGERDFEFDSVFNTASTQDQVFEDAKRLVESCIDGFNVCIFAYGQTGSGKTFTMTGSTEMPGLTPRSITELFTLIKEKPNFTFKVSTYFVELYNDNLVDLYWLIDNKGTLRNADGSINEPPKLDIKLDARKMVNISNVVIKEATSFDELMGLFEIGNAERHVGSTKMNATSSRSHSIFAIMVESYDPTTKRTAIGKLSLVDLAGSERNDKTGATGNTLKEAQSINKSLSALGNVIAALSEGEKYIPYRGNKLTQLMQDSLGGNAKTLIPADYNVDETYSSLNYAARVKKIVNNASKQAESEEVARLKQVIKRLQAGQVVATEDITGMQLVQQTFADDNNADRDEEEQEDQEDHQETSRDRNNDSMDREDALETASRLYGNEGNESSQ